MTARESGSAYVVPTPRALLLIPSILIVVAAALSPASELYSAGC